MSRPQLLAPEQKEQIKLLRNRDAKRWSFRALGREFGVSDTYIYRLFHPEIAERMRRPPGYRREMHSAVKAQKVKELQAQIPICDLRGLTARICGDPNPDDRRRTPPVKYLPYLSKASIHSPV